MVRRSKITQLLNANKAKDSALIQGWIRTLRESKKFSFVELNDGSCLANIQVIVDNDIGNNWCSNIS